MLGQFKDAEELISRVEPVCHKIQLKLTLAKLLLMKLSINLELNMFDDFETSIIEIKNIFDELDHEEGKIELVFMKLVHHMKILDKIIKNKQAITKRQTTVSIDEIKSP
jgi:hypothetical protein